MVWGVVLGALLVMAVAGLWGVSALVDQAARRRVRGALHALGLRGDFRAMSLSLDGTVKVQDLDMRDPDGTIVAHVEKAWLYLPIRELLHGRVRITRAVFEGADVMVGKPRTLLRLARRFWPGVGGGIGVASRGKTGHEGLWRLLPELVNLKGRVVVGLGSRVLTLEGIDMAIQRSGTEDIVGDFSARAHGLGCRGCALRGLLESDTRGFRIELRPQGWFSLKGWLPGGGGRVSIATLVLRTDVDTGRLVVEAREVHMKPEAEVSRLTGGRVLLRGDVLAQGASLHISPPVQGSSNGLVRGLAAWGLQVPVSIRGRKQVDLYVGNLNLSAKASQAGWSAYLDAEVTESHGRRGVVSGSLRYSKDRIELDADASGRWLVSLAAAVVDRHLLDWPRSSMAVQAKLRFGKQKLTGNVEISGNGLWFFWTKLCLVPAGPLSPSLDLQFEFDRQEGTLNVEVLRASLGEAWARGLLGLRGLFGTPKADVTFEIPEQSCSKLYKAVPRVVVPRLRGARFRGKLAMRAHLTTDFSDLSKTRLSVWIDADKCKADSLGWLVDVDSLLRDDYVFEIHEEDLDHPIRVGPGTESYVSLHDIPIAVQQAALATEDMGFYRHHGFKANLIRRAIALNLEHGWYVYGGSTITQQLVKNLFLSREKTLSRKLEEAVITWVVEQKVPKDRILELYLNCIEFGRHIYGIRAAARAYFNKEPWDLTALEGAYIMATKPNPKYAYKVYQRRVFNSWWVKRMKGILERLWRKMGVITRKQATTPDPCPPGGPAGRYLVPCFYYPDDGVYMQPRVTGVPKAPKGMPKELPRDDGRPWLRR